MTDLAEWMRARPARAAGDDPITLWLAWPAPPGPAGEPATLELCAGREGDDAHVSLPLARPLTPVVEASERQGVQAILAGCPDTEPAVEGVHLVRLGGAR